MPGAAQAGPLMGALLWVGAACVMAVGSGSGQQSSAPRAVPRCDYRIGGNVTKKRIFRPGGRLVFTAGLEHTGHHLWHEGIWKHAVREGASVAGWTSLVVHRRSEHYRNRCERDAENERWASGGGGGAYAAIRGEMASALASDAIGAEGLGFGAFSGVRYLKSCSYPCENGGRNPDASFIARASEAAGVDARVLVMTRDPADVVDDWSLRRMYALVGSCERLEAQLAALDARFYACVPYHAYDDAGVVARVSAFLGVPLAQAIAASYRLSRRDDRGVPRRAPMAIRIAFSDLAACSSRLDAVCNGTATAPYPARASSARRDRRERRRKRAERDHAAEQALRDAPEGVWPALQLLFRALFKSPRRPAAP